MAIETPVNATPLDRLGHAVHELPHWMGRHWKSLALTVTALGGAGVLAITHDRGPQTAPQDKAPASDTINPPEGGQNIGIVINPPKESTPPPSVSIPLPEQPKINPVEEAIKKGEIVISSPKEAEGFFTSVSQSEAANLEVKNDKETICLPVKNLESHSKLKIGNFNRGGITSVGILGIEPRDIIVASTSGIARLLELNDQRLGGSFYLIEIKTGTATIQILVKGSGAEELIEKGATKETIVKLGDPILKVISPESFPENYGNYQASISKRIGNSFEEVSVDNLIKSNGKFASIG